MFSFDLSAMVENSRGAVEFTEGERREFKHNGFLVIPDAIDDEALGQIRDVVWDSIPEDPESRDDLLEAEYRNLGGKDPSVTDREPFYPIWEQMFSYADELVGGDSLIAPEPSDLDGWLSLNLNFPDEGRPEDANSPSTSDISGHVDGFGDGFSEPPGFTIAGTVYVDRVPPRGGGLTVWPGSHWSAAEHFESNDVEGFVDAQSNQNEPPYDVGDPFEVAGGAGSLVLWHGRLQHTTGVNLGSNVRVGLFKRFHHEDYDDHWEQDLEQPFAHWPAIQDIDTKGTHLQ